MSNVISLASRRAATQTPAFKPTPSSLEKMPGTFTAERREAIATALDTALFYIRTTDTQQGIYAATAKAVRAASMLKQACSESARSAS